MLVPVVVPVRLPVPWVVPGRRPAILNNCTLVIAPKATFESKFMNIIVVQMRTCSLFGSRTTSLAAAFELWQTGHSQSAEARRWCQCAYVETFQNVCERLPTVVLNTCAARSAEYSQFQKERRQHEATVPAHQGKRGGRLWEEAHREQQVQLSLAVFERSWGVFNSQDSNVVSSSNRNRNRELLNWHKLHPLFNRQTDRQIYYRKTVQLQPKKKTS